MSLDQFLSINLMHQFNQCYYFMWNFNQFSISLSSFFYSCFARALYSSLGPNMIHLINLLVSLIMLSLNHQNHKQCPNGVMFLTHYINRSSSKLLEAYSLNLLTITMETSKSKNIHTTSSPPFFLQIW